MLIAIDFDGTIVEHRYPQIGKERPFATETIRRLIADRHRIILWTLRKGRLLDEAVEWCRERGIEFYAINSSYPGEEIDGDTCRKIKYDIVIDDPESVESALATIHSAISMWDAFITKAMAVSYENLTMISDKIKLSTKGVFRRFKFFGFDLFVQAPNENSKIKMYVDFRASADPSVKAQLVDRFNLSLTDKGNVSSSQKMSVGDADVITYNTIKDMLGDVTFKRVFSLLGVPCTSKDKFVQFLKDKGLMSDVEIRQMLRDDAANNAKSSINSLTQDEFERLVNMISNAYHTVVEKRNVQRFVTIDKSYV